MKANKALKRLTKIEALISDVTARYSSGSEHIGQALQDAMAAIARVKAAIAKSPAVKATSSIKRVTGKSPSAKTAKKSTPISNAVKETGAKKAAPAQKKTAVKKAAAKTSIAKTSKKSAPMNSAKKTPLTPLHIPTPVQAVTKPTAEEPMPAPRVEVRH